MSSDAKEALDNAGTTRRFKKGDFLLKQGEISRFSFLIEQGTLRKYYLKEDKEITTELLFPEDSAISFASYTLQQPSKEYIQAIEDVTTSVTEHRAFQKLKLKFPEFMQLDLMMTEYHAMWLEERLFQFHTLDATQRYLRLLKEQPKYVENIQLTHIASYLGISLETLSRIRAKI